MTPFSAWDLLSIDTRFLIFSARITKLHAECLLFGQLLPLFVQWDLLIESSAKPIHR